ncbi:MAG: hypothetical protein H6983_24095 [Ectothiorhodospiraceae bacterium]|nr:hypothetical protein [Chromatiales bacterium]MCP5157281.1 hypothetical protein [Ectothiorhodospiraceae bacterium]
MTAFDVDRRREVLVGIGARGACLEQLLAYNESRFDTGSVSRDGPWPLPDEPFVETWAGYVARAAETGVLAALGADLVQLAFPIREGISTTPEYRAVVRRGEPPAATALASGLALRAPEALRLELRATAAGRVPVLVAPERDDFESLVRALVRRNEPVPIAPSLGAVMVAGYANWGRIRAHRRRWAAEHPAGHWPAEFERLTADPARYQDRFVIVSEGPYSAVPAAELGVGDATWRRLSLEIRIRHECTHYCTKRLLGSMRNNLLDEIVADFMALVGATGRFRADWFARFMGIEAAPLLRPGGRLELYRGDPPLDDEALATLGVLVARAAATLEAFAAAVTPDDGPAGDARLLLALATQSLEAIAAEDGLERLVAHY